MSFSLSALHCAQTSCRGCPCDVCVDMYYRAPLLQARSASGNTFASCIMAWCNVHGGLI